MVFLVNVLVNGSMVEQFVSMVKDEIVAKHTKHQGHKSVKGGRNVAYIRIGLILPVFEMNHGGRNGQGLIKKNCQNHLKVTENTIITYRDKNFWGRLAKRGDHSLLLG